MRSANPCTVMAAAVRHALPGMARERAAFRRLFSNGLAPDGTPVSLTPEKLKELLQGAEKEGEAEKPKVCPADRCVLLFPGQGSQHPGMAGPQALRYPSVRVMFLAAEQVLGYDLLHLCQHGPREQLNMTVHAQPALYVTSLAAVERLCHEQPQVIETCVAAAGFSVGEFAALVFAGVLDFSEALYAVKVRAEAMQEASRAVPSGMLSVIGSPQSRYNFACLEARQHCKSLGLATPVCEVANYLFPDARVIAGHSQALEYLQNNSRKYHFKRTRMLPVSGAFHTSLMEPAVEPLKEVLQTLEFKKPLISVYCNVDGKRYKTAEHIPKILVKQLVSPVKWEQTLHALYERKKGTQFPRTFEVGPGKQLGFMLKACNTQAWKFYKHVDIAHAETEETDLE